MTQSANNLTKNLLTAQQDKLALLHEVLLEEKSVLGQYSPAALESVEDKKSALLNDIQSIDDSISASPTAIAEIQSGEYAELMTNIQRILADCKALNEINGAVIQQSQITVNRMRTSILESQGKSSLTYNEKAKTSTGVNTLNIKA